MGKMFDLLKEGLEEAIEYHKGTIKLNTKKVFIPEAPKNYNAKEIKNLRTKLGLTQQEFASFLNVSLNTIQGWEQGLRNPSHSSLRLLEMFDKDFAFIKRILTNKKPLRKLEKKSGNSLHISSNVTMVAKSKTR